MGWTPGGVAPAVCACVQRRKTQSRSRIRTDGRTVVLGRVRSSKKRLASSRPTTRRTCHRSVAIAVHIVPYDRDLDRAFTNILRQVVRMRRRQVPHRQASTPRPPHVMFLTMPSPRLAIFIACYVARAGEGLGTRLPHYIVFTSAQMVIYYGFAHKSIKWWNRVFFHVGPVTGQRLPGKWQQDDSVGVQASCCQELAGRV